MRKVAVASITAIVTSLSLISPASAQIEETQQTLGSSEVFTVYTTRDKDGKVDEQWVEGPSGTVCSTETPGAADFMWSVENKRCVYKDPLKVIKEITSYITSISAAINAVQSIVNNASKLIK